ncbi:DUF2059 domain-containing protein [Pannonibacter indicus]|uniref:DUF2059 domain-containing protein n=1 Tax=Pannonibacter indicus TaxID=466044 RepID=A0A0K6HZD1_9HYPH|nr:DUF2059 domain-containing protein [Pannonibacter indicus]CUA96274.1 Uncharacterized protein Ga0061067_10595 [Pannonibacter indicus]
MNLKALFSAGVVVAGLAFAPSAMAQDLTESHLAAARRAVIATDALSAFDSIIPELAERTTGIFIQADPSLTGVLDEVVTEVALKMTEERPELNRMVFEVWARRLSEEELTEIANFYESPTGKKLTQLSPEISALSIGAARQWQDKLSQEMVMQVRGELEKRGLIKP